MGHVEDRWTKPGPNGRRIKSERYGRGKRWLAVWGEPRRKKAFTVKDAAISHVQDMEAQPAGQLMDGGATLMSAYGDHWIQAQLHQRDSTRKSLLAHWNKRILPALGDLALRDVQRHHIQAAVVEWSATLAPTTLDVTYTYVAAILKSAVQDGMIPRSPAVKISRPPIARVRVEPLSAMQVRLIAEKAEKWIRPMVLFAAATGVRPGELRGLTTDRIQWTDDGASIRVDRQLLSTAPTWGPLKTEGSDRTIQVGQETAAMLRRHLAEYPGSHGLVFTNLKRGPWDRRGMAAAWTRITEGVVPVSRSKWHQLRHHHASLLIADGRSPRAVADRLGHTDPAETLRTYSHLWVDDDARSVAAVEASLWSQGLRAV